jgi:hypothetical protein
MQHLKTCDAYQDFIDREVAADKEATEQHVPSGYVMVITSKVKWSKKDRQYIGQKKGNKKDKQ